MFQTENGVPHDASGVSDSTETHPQQEIFEIGEETDEQLTETLAEDENRKLPTVPSAEPRQFHEENTFEEICNCTRLKVAVVSVNGDRCPFCGKVIDTKMDKQQRLGSASCSRVCEDGESPSSTSENEPSSTLCQTLATGLVMVPETHETSLGDDQSTEERETVDLRTPGAVGPGAERKGEKIPVDGKCNLFSVCLCLYE